MFACLRVFFAQDAKGHRLEPILRLGRRSSPSVPGICGVWREWGRSGSTLSLRPICSLLVDLSTRRWRLPFYVLTPAGARGSRREILGLLCAKEGLAWAGLGC